MEAIANYHDFSGFTELRARASANADGTGKEVAAQFESIFIQIMLKSMRDTLPEGGIFDSQRLDMYQDMLDKQVSLDMSMNGGIGLAEIIEQQLGLGAGEGQPASAHGKSNASTVGYSAEDIIVRHPVAPALALKRPSTEAVAVTAIGQSKDQSEASITRDARNTQVSGKRMPEANPLNPAHEVGLDLDQTGPFWRPSSPGEFVSQLRNYAQKAAKELGVSDNLLIAQAALETGWGQKIMRRLDGSSSFNLFGIKASQSWEGDKVSKQTLEYHEGIARKERATFRAYTSIGEAFGDYIQFLHSNPRYAEALSNAENDEGYARGLQEAGYATDPAYAHKILTIKQRLEQGQIALALKNRDESSLM